MNRARLKRVTEEVENPAAAALSTIAPSRTECNATGAMFDVVFVAPISDRLRRVRAPGRRNADATGCPCLPRWRGAGRHRRPAPFPNAHCVRWGRRLWWLPAAAFDSTLRALGFCKKIYATNRCKRNTCNRRFLTFPVFSCFLFFRLFTCKIRKVSYKSAEKPLTVGFVNADNYADSLQITFR